MRTTLLSLLFLLLSNCVFAQSMLSARNPEQDWIRKQATIEQATITVQPLGIYSEVNLFLTFSARGTTFPSEDSLEVSLDFTLPEEAAIIDSWLWIDDIIVKAAILDRRTARDIYEEIVSRRQDPSILYKTGPGQYQLRVYPMLGDGSRKVKISFLIPNQWTAGQVALDLPMEIVTSSRIPLNSIELRAWMKPEWGLPYLLEAPETEFQWVQDPLLGAFYRTELSHGDISPILSLGMEAPLEGGIYVNQNDSLKTYEVVLLPEELIDLPAVPARNILAILDYKSVGSNNLGRGHLLEGLRRELLNGLTPSDRFQLWSTSLAADITPLTNGWASGEESALQEAFDAISGEDIQIDGSLMGALYAALSLAETEGQEIDILLASNSQDEGGPWQSNGLIEELRNRAGLQKVNIHIIDYLNEDIEEWSDWWAPTDWKGNEVFYSGLALLSGGSFRRAGQYRYKLRKALATTDRLRAPVEMHTSVSGGICYNRYLLGGSAAQRALRSPLYQVGRYFGDFPLRIEYSALIDGVPVFTSKEIDTETAYLADTLAEQAWAANYLLSLENNNNGESILQEVVDNSIFYRVLSTQTAFLCLEPNQGGEPCITCIDGSPGVPPLVSTDEAGANDQRLRIQAFPNPFTERVEIKAELLAGASAGIYQFYIFDSLGRIVKVLPVEQLAPGREMSLYWEGRDADGREVPAGLYLLVVRSAQGTAVVKLLKV